MCCLHTESYIDYVDVILSETYCHSTIVFRNLLYIWVLRKYWLSIAFFEKGNFSLWSSHLIDTYTDLQIYVESFSQIVQIINLFTETWQYFMSMHLRESCVNHTNCKCICHLCCQITCSISHSFIRLSLGQQFFHWLFSSYNVLKRATYINCVCL